MPFEFEYCPLANQHLLASSPHPYQLRNPFPHKKKCSAWQLIRFPGGRVGSTRCGVNTMWCGPTNKHMYSLKHAHMRTQTYCISRLIQLPTHGSCVFVLSVFCRVKPTACWDVPPTTKSPIQVSMQSAHVLLACLYSSNCIVFLLCCWSFQTWSKYCEINI